MNMNIGDWCVAGYRCYKYKGSQNLYRKETRYDMDTDRAD